MIEMMKVRRKPNPKCKNEEMIIKVDKDLFWLFKELFTLSIYRAGQQWYGSSISGILLKCEEQSAYCGATSTGHYFFSATAFEMIETKKMTKDKTFSLPVGFFY